MRSCLLKGLSMHLCCRSEKPKQCTLTGAQDVSYVFFRTMEVNRDSTLHLVLSFCSTPFSDSRLDLLCHYRFRYPLCGNPPDFTLGFSGFLIIIVQKLDDTCFCFVCHATGARICPDLRSSLVEVISCVEPLTVWNGLPHLIYQVRKIRQKTVLQKWVSTRWMH